MKELITRDRILASHSVFFKNCHIGHAIEGPEEGGVKGQVPGDQGPVPIFVLDQHQMLLAMEVQNVKLVGMAPDNLLRLFSPKMDIFKFIRSSNLRIYHWKNEMHIIGVRRRIAKSKNEYINKKILN